MCYLLGQKSVCCAQLLHHQTHGILHLRLNDFAHECANDGGIQALGITEAEEGETVAEFAVGIVDTLDLSQNFLMGSIGLSGSAGGVPAADEVKLPAVLFDQTGNVIGGLNRGPCAPASAAEEECRDRA